MCAVVAHAAGTTNKTRIIRALLDNVSRRRAGERRARIAALRSASHSWKLELRLVHGSRSEVTLGPPNPMFYRFTDCGGVLYDATLERDGWTTDPLRPPFGPIPFHSALLAVSNLRPPLVPIFIALSRADIALILRQINASLGSRRFTNQTDACFHTGQRKPCGSPHTIRNSNENRPLNLPVSRSTSSTSRRDSRSPGPFWSVNVPLVTLRYALDFSFSMDSLT